ncbi:Uncharacterized conserved protein, DUF305 family [Micromonospora pallida]|uniref:Uncharacterized conserved protein, DUF305 family n=1 Tax=Micromonospora pallida TaxID=145854 RepID=A0A1C6SQP6_9ACTN|nr:DUF305 domain-containing protein [Micromonospora pallida]SCL31867.1 Uncharacterized conserved protein, DUF305 family [Micromonospora pallida]
MTRTYLRRAARACVGLTAALTITACGSANDHTTGAGHGMTSTPAPSSAGASPDTGNAADVMFAQMMIPHHQQAVQMADLAATRADDPDVKQLAAKIKAAQAPEIDTMTRWLTAWGKPLPTASTSTPDMHHGMPGMMTDADMTTLAAANGRDFDKQFLTMMIAHHQGAITMAKNELVQGSNTDAKNLAQRIIDDQQAEIDTMNKILTRL